MLTFNFLTWSITVGEHLRVLPNFPPYPVTTGYRRTEPAKVADVGWG